MRGSLFNKDLQIDKMKSAVSKICQFATSGQSRDLAFFGVCTLNVRAFPNGDSKFFWDVVAFVVEPYRIMTSDQPHASSMRERESPWPRSLMLLLIYWPNTGQ